VVNDAPTAAEELPLPAARDFASPHVEVAALGEIEHDTLDDTILVIEDDPTPPADPQPGVRRENYRQLFTRLRHGT
jgi:hypothetical protein